MKVFRYAGNDRPTKGQIVHFSVNIRGCVPGDEPIASYRGKGEYLGECADGFMTRAIECTKAENVGKIIFTRTLSVAD